MTDILPLLQVLTPLVSNTTLRQLSHVIFGMLVITGRITMLGLSRWTEAGGSYRTLQRLYQTALPWAELLWTFFVKQLCKPQDEYILAGDEVVISKAGQATYGLDRFFSSLHQRPIAGLSFFTFSVVHVRDAQAYPVQTTQRVKSADDKAARAAKAQVKQAKPAPAQKKPGRPKGSKNKAKQPVVLNAELVQLQQALQGLLQRLRTVLALTYVVLDGHFGNYPSAWLIRQENLHLISKLRADAALYPTFTGTYRGQGRPTKYGEKLKLHQLDAKYLKATTNENQLRTEIYQGAFYHKEFGGLLNVVIILKTNLHTQAQAHVILFSTDLTLAYERLIQFYRLRFQIEFNFRDAKQYWGLEDFMNVSETAVTNAANLSFFMVNVSHVLVQPLQKHNPSYSLLDLKAHYHGYRYVSETIKLLPQKPDAILMADIFEHIARLGMIHPVSESTAKR